LDGAFVDNCGARLVVLCVVAFFPCLEPAEAGVSDTVVAWVVDECADPNEVVLDLEGNLVHFCSDLFHNHVYVIGGEEPVRLDLLVRGV
jgi:hypothetical protein